MSGQDVEDRDGVSVWCYDGSCGVCDSDWCEHHCHEVDDKVRVEAGFAARGLGVFGLVLWSTIAAWGVVDGLGWSGLSELALKALVGVLLWATGGFVVRGLVGFKTDEEGEK